VLHALNRQGQSAGSHRNSTAGVPGRRRGGWRGQGPALRVQLPWRFESRV